MPTYLHECQDCKEEFEDFYSINDPLPPCPKCGSANIKRLINCVSKGVVELYGQDLVDKVKADTQQLKKDISKDANKYASMLGEDRYHQIQTKMDKQKKDGIIKRR